MELTENYNIATEQNKKEIKRVYPLLISIIFVTLLFIIIYFSVGMTYYINDDRNIMDNISGKFVGHPTHYGIFVSQILCQILKGLYSINPSIPFYGIVFVLTMWLSCVIFCYNIITHKEHRILNSIFLLLFIFIFLFYHIVNIQFTLVAIFPIFAVISLIFSFPKKRVWQVFYFVLIFVLSLLSVSIRRDCFILSIPFILLLLLYKFIKQKKQLAFCLIFIAMLGSAFAFNLGVDKIVFHNDKEYAAYLEYNEVRSNLFDFYGFPEYEEAQELYDSLGMSQKSVELIVKNYALDIEEASLENFKAILEYQKARVNKGDRLNNSFHMVYNGLIKDGQPQFYFLALTILVVVALKKDFKFYDALFMLLLVFGAFGLSLIISYLMKFPPRIAQSILILVNACLVCWFVESEKKEIKFNKITEYLIIVLTYVTILTPLACKQTMSASWNYDYQKNCNEEKYVLESYIHSYEDDVFYISNTAITRFTDQVFHKSYYLDNVVFGTWSSHSPNGNYTITSKGYDSLDDMFRNCNNLKLIIKYDWVFDNYNEYFNTHYGRELELVDTMNDEIYIYKVKPAT